LGVYDELPNNTSWRFVDKGFAFPNMLNPFQTAFPENISVADAQASNMDEHFVGVKIGDVNNSVQANLTMQVDDRTNGVLYLDTDERSLKAGDVFEATFTTAEAVKGFQSTLNLDGLAVLDIVSTDKVNTGNFGVFNDRKALTVSINDAQTFTVRFRATRAGKLSQMLGVSGRITRSEAYAGDGRKEVALRFRGANGATVAGLGFELYQNVPNPFVGKTQVGFHLPEAAEAVLTVVDETGRVVYRQKGQFAKGHNAFLIDRSDLPAGVLRYSVETATDAATRSMIQMR
jgi:hypothetical protein